MPTNYTKHSLPQTIDDSRIDNYLILIDKIKDQPSSIELQTKPSFLISPAGYAILCCLCDRALENQVVLRWKNRSHLFLNQLESICKTKGLPNPENYNFETDTLLLAGNKAALNLGFIEKFEAKFALSEDLFFDCKLILHELMQNTQDHSGAERYFMYAGLWDSEIHLGILDMGVSIPAKLKQKYSRNNDLEYILLSMEEGSSTRRERMGGYGLYHFYEFLKKNRAKLTIASGQAQVRHYFQTGRSQKTPLKHFLGGTWCFARLPLTEKPL